MTKVKFFPLGALLIFLNPITTHAQIAKGSFLIGGSGGFSSTKTEIPLNYIDEVKTTSLELTPKVGYFLINNLSIGVLLPFGLGRTTESNIDNLPYPGQEKIKHTLYGVGPFTRYYVPIGKIFLFGEASFYWAKHKSVYINYRDIQNNSLGDQELKTKTNSFQFGVGAAYFVAKNVSVEAVLGFMKQKDRSEVNNYTSLNSNLDESKTYLNIGLQFILVK